MTACERFRDPATGSYWKREKIKRHGRGDIMENQPQSFNTKEELQAFMRKGYQEVRKLFLPDLLDALKAKTGKSL